MYIFGNSFISAVFGSKCRLLRKKRYAKGKWICALFCRLGTIWNAEYFISENAYHSVSFKEREREQSLSPNLKIFKELKKQFQGINSARLCSLTGRYTTTLFLHGSYSPHILFEDSSIGVPVRQPYSFSVPSPPRLFKNSTTGCRIPPPKYTVSSMLERLALPEHTYNLSLLSKMIYGPEERVQFPNS